MKHINVRQLLRGFNNLFPLPDEGLMVIRKEGDFYLTPDPIRGTYVIKNEVPVPDQMVPKKDNIIGQITDEKKTTFEQLKQTVSQMEKQPLIATKSKYNIPAGFFKGKQSFQCIHGCQSGCVDCDSKVID